MELEGIVHGVAGWYAQRCWWAELGDLRQEGWVAALEAKQRPQFEALSSSLHRRNYVRQAAFFRLKEYVWAQSAPVDGRKGHGRRTLKGLHRAPLEALYAYAAPDLEEVEACERWWAGLSEVVHQVVNNGHDGAVAARVLLAREKPADVATDVGWAIHRVWRASSRARKRIKGDLDLHHAMMQGA